MMKGVRGKSSFRLQKYLCNDMKKLLLIFLILITNAVRSQSIENADVCLIWITSLKPYATFGMTEDEIETTKILREKNPKVFVQGVITTINEVDTPIYLVVYTRGEVGHENVAYLEYSEFIEFYNIKLDD